MLFLSLSRLKCIFRILPPWEEKELPIQGRKRFPHHLHGRLGHLVIQAELAALVSGFPDNHPVLGNGIHCPRHNLPGAQWGMGCDIPKLGNVQKLECSVPAVILLPLEKDIVVLEDLT